MTCGTPWQLDLDQIEQSQSAALYIQLTNFVPWKNKPVPSWIINLKKNTLWKKRKQYKVFTSSEYDNVLDDSCGILRFI